MYVISRNAAFLFCFLSLQGPQKTRETKKWKREREKKRENGEEREEKNK